MVDNPAATVAIAALPTSACTAERCALECVFLLDTPAGHVRPQAASLFCVISVQYTDPVNDEVTNQPPS